MINKAIKYLSNIPGWRTNRKIVVIESDDWGSIRMSSHEAFKSLVSKGFPIENDHYNINDGLESYTDVLGVMEVLDKFKDSNNRSAVFTGLNVVANPDFDGIEKNRFSQYEYENVNVSYSRHHRHFGVKELWKEGVDKRIFVPEFHGREHLNVGFWMDDLSKGKSYTRMAFNKRVTGIPPVFSGNKIRDYQAAFNIESMCDVERQKEIIADGIQLFKEVHGYQPVFFVPTNGPFNTQLEFTAFQHGIKYLGIPKIHSEPLGNGKFKKHFRYLGKKGESQLVYLTRNAFFEPSSIETSKNVDWVDSCLNQIEIAFTMKKPAIISSHRVNYIGWLNEHNRSRSLFQLEELLKSILKKWPDVEFFTSSELGEIIKDSQK